MEPEAALALALLRRLSSDIREVDVGSEVDYIDAPVNSTEFVRDYVGPNKPCVIRGASATEPQLSAIALHASNQLCRRMQ